MKWVNEGKDYYVLRNKPGTRGMIATIKPICDEYWRLSILINDEDIKITTDELLPHDSDTWEEFVDLVINEANKRVATVLLDATKAVILSSRS